MFPPEFIETHAQLEGACENWLTLDAVAIDTEFERTRTYYSRPALVQVFDGEQVFFVDPLTVEDFAPLAGLLQCSHVTKVMHASEGDIEVLEQLTGVTPQPIFDTQMAAAFTGHGYSLGYRNLVQTLLGEELAKGETRSDWLQRPLSDAQVRYAALDVVHLLPMYRPLLEALIGLGRDGWLREEIQRVQKRRTADRDPRRAYLRLRQTKLASTELARLRELAAWREQKARDRDLPRQMIVRDSSLVAMALSGPTNAGDLADIPELSANAVKRYAHALLGAIEQAHGDDTPPLASPAMERRLDPWLKAMKELVKKKSESLNMPAPLLAQARVLESLVAAAAAGKHELPDALRGWRETVVGAPLMRELQRLAGA